MKSLWISLNDQERAAFRTVMAFLDGRLEERSTVHWALQLSPNDSTKRLALLELINSPNNMRMGEPWRTAWRLIEEYWNNPIVEDHSSSSAYNAKYQYQAGDRSRSLVKTIVGIVAPRLKVEPFSALYSHSSELPARPKKINDLFSTLLTSGELINPGFFGIGSLNDRDFLLSLAYSLDAAVNNGLDIVRRIAGIGTRRHWQFGMLYRVYYVLPLEDTDHDDEPDRFHRGMAPSVKLLHAVVSRLADIDIFSAREFVGRWKLTVSPFHLRLWAALSRDPRISSSNEVAAVLLELDNEYFWNIHKFPEIAELRAKRFKDLTAADQNLITSRIRRRPPRAQWPKEADTDEVENARLYWAVRELRRIEIAGVTLPNRDQFWIQSNIVRFADLLKMDDIHEGFQKSSRAQILSANPDNRYDLLSGEARLNALELALSSHRGGWDDDPAERASSWIRQGNVENVLKDFESIPNGGASYVKVWERFGWSHSTGNKSDLNRTARDLPKEAGRVLSLLSKLPETTISKAINGISHWLSTWAKQMIVHDKWCDIWLKIWPIAVEATNAMQVSEEEVDINVVDEHFNEQEPISLDVLNTSVGKLVGVFLTACPSLQMGNRPFDIHGELRTLRGAIMAATGRSGLIALHRLIEELPYFLHADPEWTRKHLLECLTADSANARALWRAIARRTQFSPVLEIIGETMSERVTDRRLDRETRQSLLFSLIVECLHALLKQRAPAVPYSRVQQTIRSVEDEVRSHGAEAIGRFVHDISKPNVRSPTTHSAEFIFRTAAEPFLQRVWPQERSLSTSGVSKALADLPAASGEAFSEAVTAIERFLVPFECWSMIDYGLYGDESGEPRLSRINTPAKASAFLRLLDLTIGKSDGAVIPHDLADALDQVRHAAPSLSASPIFRRLGTAARRR